MTHSSSPHLVHRHPLRIEWGQCDPAGIVFNPQYLTIFNITFGQLMMRTGLTLSELFAKYQIFGVPMVDVNIKFYLPCWFDEEVVVESTVSHWGRSSFTLHHQVLKKEGVAVECQEKRVWAIVHPEDPRKMKSVPIPQDLIACLSDPTGKTRLHR